MQKVLYEVDPYNRLVVSDTGEDGDLHKFRKVLDGQFKVGADNRLSYHIKAPLSEDEDIPHQVRITGDWSLTGNHELRLTLDKEDRDTFGDEITLQGQILDVTKDSLIFSITTRTDTGGELTYGLTLQGWWRADEKNRLSFYMRRENGAHNILIFNGAWEIDKDHQIIYQYERSVLVKKEREIHTLIFKGHWDIRKKLRVSYLLDANSHSAFDFSSSVGILAEDYIKYEVSVGVAQDAPEPVIRTIVLSGEWRLKKDVGLVFEIEYAGGQICAILFSADAELTGANTILFKLKDSVNNNDLGMTLELSHKLLTGDGEMFLRALASRRELACYAGAAWRF